MILSAWIAIHGALEEDRGLLVGDESGNVTRHVTYWLLTEEGA